MAGATYGARAALIPLWPTPSVTGTGVDPQRETITFATPHNLLDNDRVVYRPDDAAVLIGGLTAGTVYTVRVIDANTIQLKAPNAALNLITVASVDGDGKTINDTHSFVDKQAVTYVAPPQRSFYSAQVDVVVGPLIPTEGRRATAIIADVESWIESTVAALPQTRD